MGRRRMSARRLLSRRSGGDCKGGGGAYDREGNDPAENALDDISDHVEDFAGLVVVPMVRAVAVLVDVDVKRSLHLSVKIWELF